MRLQSAVRILASAKGNREADPQLIRSLHFRYVDGNQRYRPSQRGVILIAAPTGIGELRRFSLQPGTSVQMLETSYGHTTNQTMATEVTKNKGRQKKALLWE